MPKSTVFYTTEEVLAELREKHGADADIKIQNTRKPRDPNAPKRVRKTAEAAPAVAGRK